jgi:hypothetical protein
MFITPARQERTGERVLCGKLGSKLILSLLQLLIIICDNFVLSLSAVRREGGRNWIILYYNEANIPASTYTDYYLYSIIIVES